MWPDGVVPEAELRQHPLQCAKIRHSKLIKLLLQRAEQPFDPAVLPRTARLRQPMLDAEPAQAKTEEP